MGAKLSNRECEQFLFAILGGVSDAVLVVDHRGRFRLLNEKARRFLPPGCTRAPLRKLPERLGLYRGDGVTLYALHDLPIIRALRGESVEGEEMYVRPPSSPAGMWITVTAAPLRDAQNRVVGGLLIAREIESQDRSTSAIGSEAIQHSRDQYRDLQHELELSTERFLLLSRATNDLVWDWDMTTNRVWRSQAFSTLLPAPGSGESNDKITWWQGRIHPDDRERVLASIDAAVTARAESWSCEYRYLQVNGTYADVLDRGYLMYDGKGQAVRAIGAAMDTTSTKQGEEELRASEERYRLLFEDSPLPMHVYDTATLQILAANEALAGLLGYSREELLRMTLLDLRPAEDIPHLLEHIRRSIGRNNTYGQFRHRRKDGTLVHVEARGSLTRFSGHDARMVCVTDITPQKRLEEDLWQARKMEEIGRLTSGIAHDFNNLLTVINGYSSMLMKKVGPDDPLHREIAYIHEAGERAAVLTQSLLSFGRKRAPQPKVLDLNEVVLHLENLLRRVVGDDVELAMKLAAEPCQVVIDEGQFTQVIINLIVNARDAMPNGGRVTVRTAILRAAGGAELPHVRLSISDTGVGMDEVIRRRAFEPYFTTKPEGKGTGLGLSVVHQVVTHSGGRVEVESVPGSGSTFHIFLPPATGAPATDVRRQAHRILVVDDDPDTRRLLRAFLEEANFRVLEANNGEQASRMQRDQPADLVITDLVMPEREGLETIRALHREFPNLRIIAISAAVDTTYLAIAGHLGAQAVFHKPLDLDALMGAIRGDAN